MKILFKRLVRFKDANNDILYGEAPIDTSNLVGHRVPAYTGDNPWILEATDRTAVVAEVTF